MVCGIDILIVILFARKSTTQTNFLWFFKNYFWYKNIFNNDRILVAKKIPFERRREVDIIKSK